MFRNINLILLLQLPDGVTAKILNLKMLEVGKVHCVENISKGRFMVKFKYHLDAERCVSILFVCIFYGS